MMAPVQSVVPLEPVEPRPDRLLRSVCAKQRVPQVAYSDRLIVQMVKYC